MQETSKTCKHNSVLCRLNACKSEAQLAFDIDGGQKSGRDILSIVFCYISIQSLVMRIIITIVLTISPASTENGNRCVRIVTCIPLWCGKSITNVKQLTLHHRRRPRHHWRHRHGQQFSFAFPRSFSLPFPLVRLDLNFTLRALGGLICTAVLR